MRAASAGWIVALVLAAVLLTAPALAPAAGDHPLDRAAALLAEAVPHVEKACGARFETPPRVVEMTRDRAETAFAADLRPEYARRYAALAERPRESLLARAAEVSVGSCVARYSFSEKAVVVVREGFDAQCAALKAEGDAATHVLRAALAHEAVHALDDARFGLAKLYRGVKDDEALRAVAMLAEGRAVHFGCAAAEAAGVPRDVAALLPGGAEPKGEREWHLHLTYRLGAEFTAALVARGGTKLADRAMAEPPALTWQVCDPSRWPDAQPDARPGEILAKAGLAEAAAPLSALQLLERYAAKKDLRTARELFAGYRGGAQALTDATNAAVLAFADEDAARRYEELSRAETATLRRGTLVARAAGAAPEGTLARLAAALPAARGGTPPGAR